MNQVRYECPVTGNTIPEEETIEVEVHKLDGQGYHPLEVGTSRPIRIQSNKVHTSYNSIDVYTLSNGRPFMLYKETQTNGRNVDFEDLDDEHQEMWETVVEAAFE